MIRKILIVILVFIVVTGIGLGYFMLYQEKENQERLRKEAELNLKVTRTENKKLKENINNLKQQIQEAKKQLEVQLNEKQKMQKSLNSLNEALSNAKNEISILNQERKVLLGRLDKQEATIKELKEKISNLVKKEETLVAPETKETSLTSKTPVSKEVKLGNIKVEEKKTEVSGKENTLQKSTQPSKISAEVMAFNKEYKFIVINKGEKDGILSQSAYTMLVQGNKVGRVKPDRVYDSMSVFDILEGGDKINEGLEIELVPEQ